MTYPTWYQSYAVNFEKNVLIQEAAIVQKATLSLVDLQGNVAMANADAKAVGYDTLAQSLTLTSVKPLFYGFNEAASFSESISATDNYI